MSWSLVFLPVVAEDADTAVRWYEDRVSGLGKRFRAVLLDTAATLTEHALAFPRIEGEFRRVVLSTTAHEKISHRVHREHRGQGLGKLPGVHRIVSFRKRNRLVNHRFFPPTVFSLWSL